MNPNVICTASGAHSVIDVCGSGPDVASRSLLFSPEQVQRCSSFSRSMKMEADFVS